MKKFLFVSLLLIQLMSHAADKENTKKRDPLTLKDLALQELINQKVPKLDILETIKKIIETRVVKPQGVIIEAYISWLNQNPTAPIIVNQTGLAVFKEMGFSESDIPEEWKQLPIDISKYVIPNSPIKDWEKRKGTLAYFLSETPVINRSYVDGVDFYISRELTVLDGWNLLDSKKDYRSISFSNNFLTYFNLESLAGLNKLEKLDLGGNQLTVLNPEAFAGLNNLKKLNLASNQLEDISGAFRPLVNLEELNLVNNRLNTLNSEAFAGLNNLKKLNLSLEVVYRSGPTKYNKIKSVSEKAFNQLNKLEELDLGGNQLTFLNPEAFAGLNNLKKLNLASNQLEDISGAFRPLVNLEELNLTGNLLNSLDPKTFTGLANLKKLHLYSSKITEIAPGTFATLLHLTHLNLGQNPELKLKEPDNLAAIKSERPEWFIAP